MLRVACRPRPCRPGPAATTLSLAVAPIGVEREGGRPCLLAAARTAAADLGEKGPLLPSMRPYGARRPAPAAARQGKREGGVAAARVSRGKGAERLEYTFLH